MFKMGTALNICLGIKVNYYIAVQSTVFDLEARHLPNEFNDSWSH